MKRSKLTVGLLAVVVAACDRVVDANWPPSGAGLATVTEGLVTTAPPTAPRVSLGAAGTITRSTAITLYVSASGVGAASVAEFCVADEPICPSGNWISLAVPVPRLLSYATSFTLSADEGPHVVRVWFKDDYGNTTRTPATVRVVLDTVPPVDGSVSAAPLNGGVRVSVAGASDAGTGVGRYIVVADTAGTPADCSGAALACTADLTCRGLVNNQPYDLLVCAVDRAGNVSTGVPASVTPRRNLVPPTLTSLSIQPPGGVYTAASDATMLVSVRAAGSAVVTDVCAAEAPATVCPGPWTPVDTPQAAVARFELPWSFSPGDGKKVVRVWARDDSMNVTRLPATQTFVVDSEAPVDGSVRVIPEPDGRFTVRVAGATDAVSGVATYLVGVNPDGTAAADCSSPVTCRAAGDRILCGALGDGITVTGAFVCAVDRAGNVSPGVSVDADPPAGQLVTMMFKDVPFDFSYVPDGTFLMGAPASDVEAAPIEKRQHYVTLTKPFLMARTETTRAQWTAVTGTVPPYGPADDAKPVDRFSWAEVVAFCDGMSDLEGVDRGTYGLPTEAQWEYAARAGGTSPRWGRIEEIAWYGLNSGRDVHAVATRRPNGWGLYDMLGNVWEWTSDWHGPYTSDWQTDPAGPSKGTGRVVRGGAWNAPATVARVSGYRYNGESLRGYFAVGFRVRRTLP